MEIIDKRADGYCNFVELDIGDIFYCDGCFFLKTEQVYVNGIDYNAVALSNKECGAFAPFRDDEWVTRRTGSLVLE